MCDRRSAVSECATTEIPKRPDHIRPARVARPFFARFFAVRRKLRVRAPLCSASLRAPWRRLPLRFHRSWLEELGLTRGPAAALRSASRRLAGDAESPSSGLPLRSRVLLRFPSLERTFRAGPRGFRGHCLAVHVFGLFSVNEAHFNPCCWVGMDGFGSSRCGPVSTICRSPIIVRCSRAPRASCRRCHMAPGGARKSPLAIEANSY